MTSRVSFLDFKLRIQFNFMTTRHEIRFTFLKAKQNFNDSVDGQ